VERDASGNVPANGATPAVEIRTLPGGSPSGNRFLRGDPTGDGKVDLADGVLILSYLFTGGAAPGCLAAADANASGGVDLTDAVYLLGSLFLGGALPPAPYPACGPDPSGGPPGCAASDPACR